jgi:uncharacterized protein
MEKNVLVYSAPTCPYFIRVNWYGYLNNLNHKPFWITIIASWGITFVEYCLLDN